MKEAIKFLYIALAVFWIVSSETSIKSMAIKLFDAHCHLHDQRVLDKAPHLIETANDAGVVYIAVNGITEKDWHAVKEMSDEYESVIPNFGLNPWFVEERIPSWFHTLKQLLKANPSAAVGEVEVFKKQLELAKEMERPASVHCLNAFPELLQIMKCDTPFFQWNARGCSSTHTAWLLLLILWTFDATGRRQGQRKWKAVPLDRISVETDAPDALPTNPIYFVPGNDILNQPANVHSVLIYVASLLEMSEEELAEISYNNAVGVFSFQG
ncbi:putative Ubiquitin carboxyl-terminal hydrolase family protein [Hibiscus syriacus]|uniref:Ubiquitin carboxyl-terminal hydrolase family protein n=1 Tax=Hibiscus syriacus TaxID=106335 RepID=A0A6A3CYX3_HIBSY|nr:putative Ubiquitin carboxyl-terminal hydrolase family protein [Hibiscus syriacus]